MPKSFSESKQRWRALTGKSVGSNLITSNCFVYSSVVSESFLPLNASCFLEGIASHLRMMDIGLKNAPIGE